MRYCAGWNGIPTVILPGAIIWGKPSVIFWVENYNTQDGFLKHILLLCFSWQGFIFQIKTISLTHLQCYFYKTNPSELLRFKISLWFALTDVQGSFLKPQFCDRLINTSIWIEFFTAAVSELKNCTFRSSLVCQVSPNNDSPLSVFNLSLLKMFSNKTQQTFEK